MAICYYEGLIGKMLMKQGDKKYSIEIRQGNCLAVLIHRFKKDGKHYVSLFMFFADEKHLKNLMKNEGRIFFDDVTSIKLNTYYKESATLLKYMTRAGYKVTCYYKEPKK